MAKEVRVSDDDGTTWYLLPGGSGEWNDEAGNIEDTIFGQTFQSGQSGLINWTLNANALYKGFAGYVAKISVSGVSTAVTGEAFTLVSGKTYRITAASKNLWNPAVAAVIKDNAVAVSGANIQNIDYMFGTVTFVSGYTPTGPITADISYYPLTEVAKGNSFTLTQTAEALEKTDFPTARANGGYRVYEPGLRTITLEIGGFYDAASAFWDVLEDRADILLEVNPDGSGLSRSRGFFKLLTRGQSGDVGALETETRNFTLSVPQNVSQVFNWNHATNTTLAQGVRKILDAFINEELIRVQYLPDGLGFMAFTGDSVVTDVSLSSGLDAMNEFTANFQGSGAPTRAVVSS